MSSLDKNPLVSVSDVPAEQKLAQLERRVRREKVARIEAENLLVDKSTELYDALVTARKHQHSLQVALWGSGDYLWEWSAETDTVEISEIRDQDSPMITTKISLVEFFQSIHPSDLHLVMMEWNSHLFGQSEGVDAQFRVKRGDDWNWLRMRGRNIYSGEEQIPPVIAGTSRNISEQQRDRRNLELLVNAFDNTKEGMCLLSASRKVIDSNRSFNQLLAKRGVQVSGQSLDAFFPLDQLARINEALDQAVSEGEWQGELTLGGRLKDQSIPTWIGITAMRDNDTLSYFVLSAIDITERIETEKTLQKLANYDALTQLCNRGYFEMRLQRAIDHARRSKESMALLFVDLDRFKQINDTMGHKAGDDLLQTLAFRLNESVRKTDLVGRWGGDEFVVLLTALKTNNDAYRVAEKVREAVLQPMLLQGLSLTVSASIGVALFPQDADDISELLDRADTAMYEAKSNGRNKVGCYEQGMNVATSDLLMLEGALRNAVNNNELILHYQPKVCLSDKKVRSIEALIRWNSPEHGFVSPGKFIPLAEDAGIILEIGSWVLRTAVEQLAAWQGTRYEDIRIAVNVSANQLRQPGLVEEIEGLLTQHNVAAKNLEIELTESSLLTDVEEIRVLFQQLRDMGLSIAIDDFGTGYSSLAYLKDLPITTLKVDRAFVSQIGVDEKGEALAKTVINLAQSLSLKVVAEGVETETQDEFMRRYDCDEGQGFLYYRPLPIDELESAI